MRKFIFAILGLVLGFISSEGYAASVVIDKYPTSVRAGDKVDVQITWSGVPKDKDYVLRVQLENWDVNPGICVFKDLEKFGESGTEVITLDVPKNTTKGSGCRILAAFLSKSAEWDDVLVVAESQKNINVGSLLAIQDYPKEIQAGQDVTVDVAWEGVPTNENYKLVVQLENWDVKPGIVYLKEVTSFKAKDNQKVTISVPANARGANGCRLIAAFISQTEGWNKVFSIDRTEKDVTIKVAVPQTQA
jgi:hypothetical protein